MPSIVSLTTRQRVHPIGLSEFKILTQAKPSLMVYEEDKTFKIPDTLITLVSFKKGEIGLVLLGVDQIYFEKRLDDEKFKLSRFNIKDLMFIKKGEGLFWNVKYGEAMSVDESTSLKF